MDSLESGVISIEASYRVAAFGDILGSLITLLLLFDHRDVEVFDRRLVFK